MKKIVLLALGMVLLYSCKNTEKKESEPIESVEKEKVEVDASKKRIHNYAIIWKWTTTDKKLVEDNLTTIANEMNNLWKQDLVVDAYYNSNATVDKFEYFPNITFFLKASSYEEAEIILNKLTLVKKGIAVYTIYPVGLEWLNRNTKVINEKGLTNSYVSVWKTKNMENSSDDLIKSQADEILKLWNAGTIENVYFDIEGTQKPNNQTDFVFFINTNSEDEARKICEALPFVKENIASYEIYAVGVYWLGKHSEN